MPQGFGLTLKELLEAKEMSSCPTPCFAANVVQNARQPESQTVKTFKNHMNIMGYHGIFIYIYICIYICMSSYIHTTGCNHIPADTTEEPSNSTLNSFAHDIPLYHHDTIVNFHECTTALRRKGACLAPWKTKDAFAQAWLRQRGFCQGYGTLVKIQCVFVFMLIIDDNCVYE